ncbi:MAG: hypothetical protein JSU94_19945 [Phycisphaerales bacterium]|nr:MAG: hypothetical protein JSU94_19945 [Phycisphaerales bacterium]
MAAFGRIITVGLSPCWDTVYRVAGIDWGEHKLVGLPSCRPAGKALNISRALAWLGQESTAAGLWGRDDYGRMVEAMRPLRQLVGIRMTQVEPETRRNVTVVDTLRGREMHLRTKSELVSRKALPVLKADLGQMIKRGSVCVFAGQMAEARFTEDVVRLIRFCGRCGARVVLDTWGDALRRSVDGGIAWLIKPNVEELRELLGQRVRDTPASLAKAGRRLLDRVEMVLISRGQKGAVAVTKGGAWEGRAAGRARAISTVGCGDYLLAGFLKGLKDTSEVGSALETAIEVATAKAWGWTESKGPARVRRGIRVEVERI